MMDRQFLTMAKSLAVITRDYVGPLVSALAKRLDEFDERIKAIPAGPQGERGLQGESGVSIKGDSGIDGKSGIDGRDGRDGKDGKDGRDGANGKDALEIQILRSIPEHPVLGMWAADNGGLWRYSTLGWEIMVDGLASFDVRIHEDMRTFSVDLLSASGDHVIKEFRIPVMLFRDIYKEGGEYFMGDVVVADNSSWHCQVESTKARPGVSPDWRLMARKGTAGKDGKNGERGPEGKPGRDGK